MSVPAPPDGTATPDSQPAAASGRPDKAALTGLARIFIAKLPHGAALGLQLEEIDEGRAVLSMPYDPKLIGDPSTGVIHGGAVSTLMDTASGTAVLSHPASSAMTATLDLRIDYMRPATPGQTIRAVAHCYHITRSVAFVRVTATDADESRPVAVGNGAFTVEHKPRTTGSP